MDGRATFTPITVTAETLGVLAKQDNYPKLLALYMGYVEISAWQETRRVKATTSFMAKRFGWSVGSIQKYKKVLRELNLIEDYTTKTTEGKVTGWYVRVSYVVNEKTLETTPPPKPGGGLDHSVDSEGTSALELKESALIQQESALSEKKEKPDRFNETDITAVQFFYSKFHEIHPDVPMANIKKSDYEQMNLLHRKDNYSYEQIKIIIHYALTNEFWARTVRSINGIRKNAQLIYLQAKSKYAQSVVPSFEEIK